MKKPMIVMAIIIVIAFVYGVQGVLMHEKVSTEEAKFHAAQEDYFLNSKATRDSAPTGSELNQDLVEIQNYPSELLRLKLVGVGKILTGIFLLLLGILMALVMMPKRLSEFIKDNQ